MNITVRSFTRHIQLSDATTDFVSLMDHTNWQKGKKKRKTSWFQVSLGLERIFLNHLGLPKLKCD